MKIRITGQVLFSLGLTLLLLILLIVTMGYGYLSKLVPMVVLVPGLMAAAAQFLRDVREAQRGDKPKPKEAKDQSTVTGTEAVVPGEGIIKEKLSPQEKRRRQLVAIGWLFAFFALITVLGLSIAIPVFILLFMKLYGRESWRLSIAMAAGMWVFIYVIFVWGMRSQLYPGMFFDWLGL